MRLSMLDVSTTVHTWFTFQITAWSSLTVLGINEIAMWFCNCLRCSEVYIEKQRHMQNQWNTSLIIEHSESETFWWVVTPFISTENTLFSDRCQREKVPKVILLQLYPLYMYISQLFSPVTLPGHILKTTDMPSHVSHYI